MNKLLKDNNYIVIPSFISPKKAIELSQEFKDHCQKNNIPEDGQSPNSRSVYNYLSFLELLCEKTPEISSILGETVIPTYSYARLYENQSILKSHTDRDACEISITLHLNGDYPWPIWIKTPGGEDKYVNLNPGDAMLYLGKIAEHWRHKYDGEWYSQVFLHYVRSRGDCAYTYFDKSRDNTIKFKDDNSKNNSETSLSNVINDNTINDNNFVGSIENNYSSIIIKSDTKLENFIRVFDDILNEDVCDFILNEYKNSEEWSQTFISNNTQDNTIRNCDQISISCDEIIEKNYEIRKNIDNLIYESVSNASKIYSKIFKTLQIEVDTGYQILRYNEGQFYIQHTDSFKLQQRSLSCSIQLNDDYEGGEFAFFDREVLIRSKKGSAILFPSNFMYPHEIMPVTKGTRYSIITWLV
jgi:predicted 2-oxoglutarate/Fe(II)-dependent dioxygenase YbiX